MPNFASRITGRTAGGAVALATVTALALVGCSARTDAGGETVVDDGRPVVLTTFTVLADMAQNVAGDHLRVESITKVGAEIHGYEPTPGDLRRAADADLILDNGMGLEAWFGRFVDGLDVPAANAYPPDASTTATTPTATLSFLDISPLHRMRDGRATRRPVHST